VSELTRPHWRRRSASAFVCVLAAVAALLVIPGAASAATCDESGSVICGTDFSAVAGNEFSGQVGTENTFCGFDNVMIEWGDGSPMSAATPTCDSPTPPANGTLTGTHTYAASGTYTVTLHSTVEVNGSLAIATAIATVRAQSADLRVTMNAPSTAKNGSTLIYALSVGNSGLDPARNVKLVDQLPYGTVFQAVTATGWNCSTPPVGTFGGTVTCTTDPLAVGSQVATSIGVKVKAHAGRGVITNAATVSSDTSDANLSDNSASVSTVITK
jgi:uncharacterized repeat protein (TIGR01451 family)